VKQILELFCDSWVYSAEFWELCQATSIGTVEQPLTRISEFNLQLGDLILEVSSGKHRIKFLIYNIIKPLFLQYPTELMNSLLTLWTRECSKEAASSLESFKPNEFLKKMLEMLLIMNLSSQLLLDALFHSQFWDKVQKFYAQKPKERKPQERVVVVLNIEMAMLESSLLYFMYNYFSFSMVDAKILTRENLIVFWRKVLKVLRVFQPSRNVSTNLWLVEFLYLFSVKFSPKEVLQEWGFKKELHDFLNDKLQALTAFFSPSSNVLFNAPQSCQLAMLEEEPGLQTFNMPLTRYRVVVPYPPAVYRMALDYFNFLQVEAQATEEAVLRSSDIELALFCNPTTEDEDDLLKKSQLSILKTLKSLGLKLMLNCYLPERTDRVGARVREFMEPVFPCLSVKNFNNLEIIECASELLFSLMEEAKDILVKEFKTNILAVFNEDDFFSCSK